MINNRTFYGSWKGENIFEALCAAYKHKPKVCYDEGAFEPDEEGISLITVIIIIVSVLVFDLLLFLICRRFIKRRITNKVDETDINLKINEVVSNYLALKEEK